MAVHSTEIVGVEFYSCTRVYEKEENGYHQDQVLDKQLLCLENHGWKWKGEGFLV